jgi:demethylmenaquinone methyltransferase / 2-methoxy-6-polyprenyl-1,4-benzoquinol methylase
MSKSQQDSAASIPPHPVLREYYGSSQERQPVVNSMFDEAAIHYDRVTLLMSFGSGGIYRRKLLSEIGVTAGSRVLDVACGTGQVSAAAMALVGPTGTVIGVDPSEGMRRVAEERRKIKTLDGTADRLSVEDGSFDFVVMGYALRHVSDLLASFREMRRVLRPGGTVMLMEIAPPKGRFSRAMMKLYMQRIVPPLTLLVTRSRKAMRLMSYYWDSIEQCVEPQVILDAMGEAGLENPRRQVSLGVFTEYIAIAP